MVLLIILYIVVVVIFSWFPKGVTRSRSECTRVSSSNTRVPVSRGVPPPSWWIPAPPPSHSGAPGRDPCAPSQAPVGLLSPQTILARGWSAGHIRVTICLFIGISYHWVLSCYYHTCVLFSACLFIMFV